MYSSMYYGTVCEFSFVIAIKEYLQSKPLEEFYFEVTFSHFAMSISGSKGANWFARSVLCVYVSFKGIF